MNDPKDPLSEFLFGRLATLEGRVRTLQSLRGGTPVLLPLDPLDPAPHQAVRVRVAIGDLDVTEVVLTYTIDGSVPPAPDSTPETTWQRLALQPLPLTWDTLTWNYQAEWAVTLPGQPEGTTVRFRVDARTRGGDWREVVPHSTTTSAPPGAIQSYHLDRLDIPDWLPRAIVYHVLLDRFAPDPPGHLPLDRDLGQIHGGTLRGLRLRLDELVSLGVNCLWLSPIHPSPSYHGYDPIDLAAIEPRLGTLADWQDLVNAAHDRGMHLLLDYVPNHVSSQHPKFRSASRDFHSRDWFHFHDWPGRYRCFFGVPGMPIWNAAHPEVRQYLLEHALLWLDRGCDGFRLDHAHGPGPAFWASFRAELRAAYPDCVLIGEITDPPDELLHYAGKLDGVLDFPLATMLRGFFAMDRVNAETLATFLDRHYRYFGGSLALPSFLDNHDMNRFLWIAGNDVRRLGLAALCLFTLPGPPILYYGTEVGLSQRAAVGQLEEARLPMPPPQCDHHLWRYFARLIALRRQGGCWPAPRITLADNRQGVLAYRSGLRQVVFNNSDGQVRIAVDVPGDARVLLATDPALEGLPWKGELPPRSGLVLESA